MNVLHITAGTLDGGAARGAYFLHKGLLSQGVNSHLLLNEHLDSDDCSLSTTAGNKIKYAMSRIRGKLDRFIPKLYKNYKNNIFSTGMIGADITKTKEYKNADIIHLHWINSGFISIKQLSKFNKPIVWTMRDMWPFTGGCHYALDCEQFESGCGSCPQLGSDTEYDLSRFVFKQKLKNYPQSIHFVGISSWISSEASRSSITKDRKVTTIFNCIDTNEFQLHDKVKARAAMGINTTKKIILCGSTSLTDFYKGFDKFIDSLAFLDSSKYMLIFFGKAEESLLSTLGFEFKSFGFVSNNRLLNLMYSSADVFVAPSIQEAFGKTVVEAMSSGTPVTCFDATGPGDIVMHLKCGYKADPFRPESLAMGIEWVVNHQEYESLRVKARERAVNTFSHVEIAKQYHKLYSSL